MEKSRNKNKGFVFCLLMTLAIVVLFALNLLTGSIHIPYDEVVRILTGSDASKPTWQYIVLETRLPETITATLCGGALAVSYRQLLRIHLRVLRFSVSAVVQAWALPW